MFPYEDSKFLSVCPYPKKDIILHRQYQSNSSDWYSNGKVFTSTTAWKPKNLNFFSENVEIEFDLYFDSRRSAEITLAFPQYSISLTVVIHISMEKSSRVLQLGNPKIGFSFQKRSKLNFYFYFDLCRNAGNHPRFVDISPTVVIGTWMERFSQVLATAWEQNNIFLMLIFVFLLSCFVNNF